ncbi:MAG: MarR family winged helix-turn-helix transcriptional regulator [Alphaproteobacteria bacterium]
MTKTSPDYQLDAQVGFLMRRANQRHLAIFSRRLPELTPMQFAACAKLHELGSVSQNDLGRQTAMDAATIKGVVDRLVRDGLVETRADPSDQRRLLARLTHTGSDLYVRSAQIAHGITEDTLAPLTAAEQRTFLTLLAKLAV